MLFDIIHTDIWTSPVLSSFGHRYYKLFLDDYSQYLLTFPLAKTSHMYDIFRVLKSHIDTHFNCEIKNVQCDNGKEYNNGTYRNFCQANCISFSFSCPRTF